MERTEKFSRVFGIVKRKLFQTGVPTVGGDGGGSSSNTAVMPNDGAPADTTAVTTTPTPSLQFRYKERVIHPEKTLEDLDGFTAADHIEYIIC